MTRRSMEEEHITKGLKTRQDPKLKEKIAQLQASFNHPDVTLGQIQAEWNKHPDEQYIIRDDDIEEYYKQADQILALLNICNR